MMSSLPGPLTTEPSGDGLQDIAEGAEEEEDLDEW
jgi:hypothetical protein